MKVIILNGSPRPKGNTAAMIGAYRKGAESAGHSVTVFDVCRMRIAGCLACECCHGKVPRTCVQKDDMHKIYPVLDEADMVVLASPIYYHGLSGQLACAIHRIYALGYPRRLKKAALLLSSGSKDVYDGAIYTYRHSFLGWLHLEDKGIFTAAGDENKSGELLDRLEVAGAALTDPGEGNVARLAIRSGDVTVEAPLNQTQAAHDLMNRLPVTLEGHNAGLGYRCAFKECACDETEWRQGWQDGDISVADGWLSILSSGQEHAYDHRVMPVAHLSDRDTAWIRSLPDTATFTLSLIEPWK